MPLLAVSIAAHDTDSALAAEGKNNTDGFDFWSSGPACKSGTDDDIGNWEKK